MAGNAINPRLGNNGPVNAGDAVWPLAPARLDPAAGRAAGPGALDPVQALAALGEEAAPASAGGMADQLLAWLTPRPRNPDTLTQSRIVPLLGMAADMLGRAASGGAQPDLARTDLARLGAAAFEQEIRMQQALADRRATLLHG